MTMKKRADKSVCPTVLRPSIRNDKAAGAPTKFVGVPALQSKGVAEFPTETVGTQRAWKSAAMQTEAKAHSQE